MCSGVEVLRRTEAHCTHATHITYLLTVAIQYNSNGLINTQYRCDYTRAHAGYITSAAPASPSVVFKQLKFKDVFFTVQRVFIAEHYLASRSYLTCQNKFRMHFPILLCQTNRQYLVWGTVSVRQEACRTETVPVDLRCYVTTQNTVNISSTLYNIVFCFLISDFNVI
jgi:hypothetical protein